MIFLQKRQILLLVCFFLFASPNVWSNTQKQPPKRRRIHNKNKIIQTIQRHKKRVRRHKKRGRNRLHCRWFRKKGYRSNLCRTFYKRQHKKELFMVVIGEKKRLYLCMGKRLLRSFPIGYGRKGFGKEREGDKKTPLGSYRILWMAARHEPYRKSFLERKLQRYQIRHKRAYCKPNSQTGISEFRRDHGPRGERLWKRPYGGRYASVMAINYPNNKDQLAHKTGSCIEIHASFHLRGSAGCITLWPRHARELYNCSHPQMRVEIRYHFK